MIAPGSRPLHVRFILPALKEASDPYWRPVLATRSNLPTHAIRLS